MKRNKSHKKKLIATAILLILVYLGFLGDHNLITLYNLKKEELSLQNHIEAGNKETRQLNTRINRLKNDPGYIEQIAREEFKMGKKGENIFIIKERR